MCSSLAAATTVARISAGMMVMICWRLTPSLAVRITITSVVLGVGGSAGGCVDGDGDCATAANGTAERMETQRKETAAGIS